ncbi:RIP metalloprotease RseP [Betaproteobacteria bacterium SCGC AG-212-J23]|nr:RIP metalloprotease RseP [Betaproteobacteria bacterium SCGC AG-212-J23]
MSFLNTLVAFIVALGVLIVVHEYGHYLVARLCGVKVLRFSIGFGRALLVKRIGKDQTEWVIAAVPFGGYVKMLDEREGPVAAHEADRAFNRQTVWRRIAIVVAGPLFNFAFAVLVYAGLFMHGLPEARPVVGAPPAGTLAAASGIGAGDTVRAIDGEPVATWQDLRWQILQAALQRHAVQVETLSERGHVTTVTIDLRDFPADDVEADVLDRIGLRLYRPMLEPVIGKVVPGGSAERSGLGPGDRVLSADGKPIKTWDDFVSVVRSKPGTPIPLLVERDGARRTVEVTADPKTRIIGAQVRQSEDYVEKMFVRVQHGPLTSLAKGFAKTWDISLFSLKMLGRMLIGEVSWKHLSGPVTIADFAGQSAQMGWISYVSFLALISISLGVLNLLPIPLLDGGHLLYYAIEIVKGGPVSERVMELGQRVGLALLLVMMAFAFYNDLNRLLTG